MLGPVQSLWYARTLGNAAQMAELRYCLCEQQEATIPRPYLVTFLIVTEPTSTYLLHSSTGHMVQTFRTLEESEPYDQLKNEVEMRWTRVISLSKRKQGFTCLQWIWSSVRKRWEQTDRRGCGEPARRDLLSPGALSFFAQTLCTNSKTQVAQQMLPDLLTFPSTFCFAATYLPAVPQCPVKLRSSSSTQVTLLLVGLPHLGEKS
ncbi:uncharacterized protein [Heterodontus francisci]|uniref:uncharacterized protein n=1 Tax=Heterodontus francisci TaxID=7792 RepID=UPI00355AE595